MTRRKKVQAVARFEFLCVVRSKSWLITTFGMPVFLLLYAGLASIPLYLESRREAQVRVYGVVDQAGLLGLDSDVALPPLELPAEIRAALEASGQQEALSRRLTWFQNLVFRPFPAEEPARAALRDGSIRGYYRIPPDYRSSGIVERYSDETGELKGTETRRALSRLLVERMIQGRLPDEVAARVREPIADSRDFVVTAEGEVKPGEAVGRVVRVLVPLGFALLLLLSILMSSGGLLQALGVEKENKVVEVLLSSANPDEILLGKLLGLGAAGSVQMTVWFGMVALTGVAFTGLLATLGVEPPWAAIAATVLFFPLAYLFFGSLMLGTGSLGSNQKEANQWGMAWSLLAALPLMFFAVLLDAPHGRAAQVLTWIPFAAPSTVIFRLALDPAGIRWWEIVGSLIVLLAATWFTIRIGARLFRVGIVLTGARPKLREILRQARLSV
ncbi:MAG TPA: ABC transporter permease [Candidatus Polarisedimenticolaceae bacterium]|nr:ABC transporter permease [Candidatus Polarisedimenticolaceae bacterium]